MYNAIRNGEVDKVKTLLGRNKEAAIELCEEELPLCLVIRGNLSSKKKIILLKLFLENGANINANDSISYPLEAAIKSLDAPLILFLIKENPQSLADSLNYLLYSFNKNDLLEILKNLREKKLLNNDLCFSGLKYSAEEEKPCFAWFLRQITQSIPRYTLTNDTFNECVKYCLKTEDEDSWKEIENYAIRSKKTSD